MPPYTRDTTKDVRLQLLAAIEYLIANGIDVDMGSAVVNVDLATVDVSALVAGIADGKTQAELHSLLTSILAKIITAPATAANQALLVGNVTPSKSTGLAAVSTTDAEWTAITLTAGALVADFSLTGASAYVVCQTATPGDADTGCIYAPNIPYRIMTRGRTKIWIRRTAGVNTTIHVTDFK